MNFKIKISRVRRVQLSNNNVAKIKENLKGSRFRSIDDIKSASLKKLKSFDEKALAYISAK